MRAPSAVNLSGNLRKSTISFSSCFASSTPATSWNVTRGLSPASIRARLRPKLMAWLLPDWVCRSMYHMKAPIRTRKMMFGRTERKMLEPDCDLNARCSFSATAVSIRVKSALKSVLYWVPFLSDQSISLPLPWATADLMSPLFAAASISE